MTRIPGELASLIQPVVLNRDQGIPRGSDKKSEWSCPDAIRRHHNPEDADKHTKTIMSPNILSSVGLHWNSDREISQEFLMRDSVGRGFSREIFPTCMFLILTCLRESVWGALGITGEITSPVCFPPTPKRVSGTLAGSRSGGRGSLADSGLVFPPVRPVPLRTARELGTERAESLKATTGQEH